MLISVLCAEVGSHILTFHYHTLFPIMSTDETFLSTPTEPTVDGITFTQFAAPSEVNEYKKLNDSILSEAYSVYTYHYFVDLTPTITYSVGDGPLHSL